MIHASLFSGIGGPEVAAAMLGWENAFHCEINPFGKAVLEYWFPNSTSYDDITKTDFKEWRGRVDVLTGGFPCQPFSYAGKRGGRNDDRYLWPEMLRVIDEVRPTWVVGENVAGITTMVEGGVLADMGCDPVMFGEGDGLHRYQLRERFTIERICADLEGLGYSVQPFLIPAAAVGAPHRRDRVFIVAYDADPDRSDAVRGPGIVPRSRGTERLQERDEVREPGVAGDVRSEVQESSPDSCDNGLQRGNFKENKRRKDKIGEDGILSKSITSTCGRGTLANTNSGRLEGTKEGGREGTGDNALRGHRVGGKGTPTNSYCSGREEPVIPGRETHPAEDGARVDDRTERFGGDLFPENRWTSFPTVSPVHRGNDGIPFDVDYLTVPPIPGPPNYGKGDPQRYPFGKWRTESLKAYGNAIVPQVMYRIFQAIEQCTEKI